MVEASLTRGRKRVEKHGGPTVLKLKLKHPMAPHKHDMSVDRNLADRTVSVSVSGQLHLTQRLMWRSQFERFDPELFHASIGVALTKANE